MIRVVLGPRVADKLVPSRGQVASAPNGPGKANTETVVRRNIIVRAPRR
jgi:hypothetical protein